MGVGLSLVKGLVPSQTNIMSDQPQPLGPQSIIGSLILGRARDKAG